MVLFIIFKLMAIYLGPRPTLGGLPGPLLGPRFTPFGHPPVRFFGVKGESFLTLGDSSLQVDLLSCFSKSSVSGSGFLGERLAKLPLLLGIMAIGGGWPCSLPDSVVKQDSHCKYYRAQSALTNADQAIIDA